MKKAAAFIFMFLVVAGCANGRGIVVRVNPTLDKRLTEVQPMPLHAGLFIEPSLRNFRQEEWQTSMIAGIHHYIFPIGEPLAANIEEMSKRVFHKVTILTGLPDPELVEKAGLDAVLTVQLQESKLDLIVEESVWRAIGKHYLSIRVSLLDKNLRTLFEDVLTAEGKNLDLIDFETEGGWWKTAGPKYGPSVEDSVEKIVFKLAQRLLVAGDHVVNRSFFEKN